MPLNRDEQVAKHILTYCKQVALAVQRFGNDEAVFRNDPVYRNACSMPLMQIGELAKKFSPAFIKGHPGIPWQAIKGMRTMFAHDYGSMDIGVIWETATKDTPVLEQCLQQFLAQTQAVDG